MTFEEIQKQAFSEWEAWQRGDKPRILVGAGTCGRAAGALEIMKVIQEELKKRNIEANITEVGCIGLCYAEPIIDIIKPDKPRICYGNVNKEIIPQLIEDYLIKDNPRPDLALGYIGDRGVNGIPNLFELPILKPQTRIILRNCGFIDPENINHYIANGGYSGLAKALKMAPEAIIDEIKKSGLRGRGGAGFPTGLKWDFCRRTPSKEKYVICNGSEGEPGAFMNRSLLEGDPHSVLEGIIIGAYAVGASEGYIYCHAEYSLALERLKLALRKAKDYGFLGGNILGSGFSFDIKIKEGAGAYVCGEETALMESIEGKRGQARYRPPFPPEQGLWQKPTIINNVETLANIPHIILKGANWFNQIGTQQSKGTMVFSVSGDVERPGIYELAMGNPLRELVEGLAGAKNIKAAQVGGASGRIIPKEEFDTPLAFEAGLGVGAVIVIGEDRDIVEIVRGDIEFFTKESCGKCIPCRIGTRQMLNILERISRGEGKLNDIDELQRLANTVRTVSLCGLGQAAPNPVLTSIRYFRDEYEEHTKKTLTVS